LHRGKVAANPSHLEIGERLVEAGLGSPDLDALEQCKFALDFVEQPRRGARDGVHDLLDALCPYRDAHAHKRWLESLEVCYDICSATGIPKGRREVVLLVVQPQQRAE